MDTERLREALCVMAGPMCRIAEDPHTQEALDALTDDLAGQPPLRVWAILVSNLVPLLLRDHADDVYAIAAVLTDTDERHLRAQNGLLTMSELRACWDEGIADFFSSAGCTGKAKC